eukprot:5049382-Pleurochrysis_carterae.AAC.1
MVFIIRGNRHHVQHSCRSDASDRDVEDIPRIPASAPTAVNALAPMPHANLTSLIWRYSPERNRPHSNIPSILPSIPIIYCFGLEPDYLPVALVARPLFETVAARSSFRPSAPMHCCYINEE